MARDKKNKETKQDSNKKDDKQKRVKKEVIVSKNEAGVTFYLNASFFLFFLISYTFLLFLHENKYPLILNNEILPEVLFACLGLFVFSFLSLFVFSFSKFLARVFLSVVVGGAVAYILGLIYPFNVGNYFAHMLSFLPQEPLLFIANSGNLVIGCLAGLLFLIIVSLLKGGAMALLSLPVLVLLFLLLNTSSTQRYPIKNENEALVKKAEEKTKSENLIYLVLADHASYIDAAESWESLNNQQQNPLTLPDSPAFIPAFYETNKFHFYPAIYLRYMDKHRNMGSALNPSLTEIGADLFSQDDAAFYTSSEDLQVFFNKNDVFDKLKRSDYALNVYQAFPFNFCKGAGEQSVTKCMTYPAPLGALYQTKMSTANRLLLLTGHWLNSTPLGKKTISLVKGVLQDKLDLSSIPFFGNPLSQSLPIGQGDVLANLRKDILSKEENQGKTAYFAHINMPHYPYVYDKNCVLREDPLSWKNHSPYSEQKELGEELSRWQGYNQQMLCTYNQIHHLMTELKTANLLDKTTVVIHGDKGAGILPKAVDEETVTVVDKAVNRFKHNMTTTFAIYKPENAKAQRVTTPCDVGTLINTELLKRQGSQCQPPDLPRYSQVEKDRSLAWVSAAVPETYYAQKDFAPYYATWVENGGLSVISALDERQKNIKERSSNAINFITPPDLKGPEKIEKEEEKEGKVLFAPVPEAKEEKQEEPPVKDSAKEPQVKESQTEESKEKEPKAELALPAFEPLAPKEKELETPFAFPDFEVVEPKEKAPSTPEPTIEPELALPEPEPEPLALPALEELALPEPEPAPLALPALEELALPEPEPAPLALPALEELALPEPEALSSLEKTLSTTPSSTKEDQPTIVAAPSIPVETKEEKKTLTVKEIELQQAQLEEQGKQKELERAQLEEQVKQEALAEVQAEEKSRQATLLELQAQAKEQEELLLKLQAQAKAQEEAIEQAKLEEQSRLEALEKAKLEEQEKQAALEKAKAEEKAKEEALALEQAKEEARLAAIEKVKAEVAQRTKERLEAEERARAEEEAKRLAEEKAKAEEEAKKQQALEAKLNQADIIKESIIENVNDYGEIETFFFLERRQNPKRVEEKPEEIKPEEVAKPEEASQELAKPEEASQEVAKPKEESEPKVEQVSSQPEQKAQESKSEEKALEIKPQPIEREL